MPRVTVYVPDDLKARMDEIGESANWSGLAQRAFREAVLTQAIRKEPTNMTNVIERLRASKVQYTAEQEAQGKKAGENWARLYAEFGQLRAVAQIDEVGFDADMMTGGEAVGFVYGAANDGDDSPLADEVAAMFGVDEGKVDEITPEFVAGFIQGATVVWQEVADKL